MKKAIATIGIITAMFGACHSLELYTLEVTATDRHITGRDIHGEAVTLTECRSADGVRILLEDAEEGDRYRVTLDSCGTWNKEDDEVIRTERR